MMTVLMRMRMMNQTTFLRNLCWKITRMVMSGFICRIFQCFFIFLVGCISFAGHN